MKRLFVSAAVLPLVYASVAAAETKISTATTAPVATATVAAGQRDDITVETNGSIRPTAAGAAVTINSSNVVKNGGTIGFNGVNNATGVLIQGGFTGSLSNTGTISVVEDFTNDNPDGDTDLDGPLAQGSGRFGVRLTGPAAFTGDIRNDGTISVEGNDSGGIRLDSRLVGVLANGGSVNVLGDRSVGVSATDVSGDVRINGSVQVRGEGSTAVALGDVGGGVRLQGVVSATGYRVSDRLADEARAKLDADDLKQGGSAVRITGNVGSGVLLDIRPADKDTNDADEDDDGVPDASEGSAAISSVGAAPALDIGSDRTTTLGAVGTGASAYGLLIKGEVVGAGINDGVAANAIRIGQAGGGATTVQGGIHVQGGRVAAVAYGSDVAAQGGAATAILINAGSTVQALRNSGTITATLNNGAQGARAVVDLSGTLSLVENTGTIGAVSTPKTGSANVGQAVALDLRANTVGAAVRQTKATSTSTPSITGDILFGSGLDRLEVAGGTVTGAISFGAGADVLSIDGGGIVTGRLTDSDGLLTISVGEGRLAVTNPETVRMSALTLGASSVLAVSIDPEANTATRFDVAGTANVAAGAQIDLNLVSLLPGQRSFEILRAGQLTSGGAGANLQNAPYLYAASVRTDAVANALYVDLKPKTAAELGLNRSGAQAYSGVFDALDKDAGIESAFLGQKTAGGFQALYDQMLPDHSGGALMSAHAISTAISGAVAGRASGEGSTGVWAQEILFRIDRDADDALGFKSSGFGIAAGLELNGANQALGVNGGFVTADYKDQFAAGGERVAMTFFEAGVYWRVAAGGFQADVRGGGGYVTFDSERRLVGTNLNRRADADWNGWLVEGHAGASYEARMGFLYVRPELSLDYLRLSEGDYAETGGGAGFDLSVDSRKSDLLTGQAVLAMGARFGDEIWWSPEIKVGWRQKLTGAPGDTTARFGTGTPFTLSAEDIYKGGLIGRVGLRGGAKQVVYGIEGGGAFDDGYKEYDVRAVVRFLF
jgi:hypothetical protein